METKVIITSFTHHTTAEGDNISYTYTEVDSDGNRLKSNARAEFLVMDDEIKQKIADIKEYIHDRKSATV